MPEAFKLWPSGVTARNLPQCSAQLVRNIHPCLPYGLWKPHAIHMYSITYQNTVIQNTSIVWVSYCISITLYIIFHHISFHGAYDRRINSVTFRRASFLGPGHGPGLRKGRTLHLGRWHTWATVKHRHIWTMVNIYIYIYNYIYVYMYIQYVCLYLVYRLVFDCILYILISASGYPCSGCDSCSRTVGVYFPSPENINPQSACVAYSKVSSGFCTIGTEHKLACLAYDVQLRCCMVGSCWILGPLVCFTSPMSWILRQPLSGKTSASSSDSSKNSLGSCRWHQVLPGVLHDFPMPFGSIWSFEKGGEGEASGAASEATGSFRRSRSLPSCDRNLAVQCPFLQIRFCTSASKKLLSEVFPQQISEMMQLLGPNITRWLFQPKATCLGEHLGLHRHSCVAGKKTPRGTARRRMTSFWESETKPHPKFCWRTDIIVIQQVARCTRTRAWSWLCSNHLPLKISWKQWTSESHCQFPSL